jgi:glucokinase
MILAGDIGGTNCRLAVFDDRLQALHLDVVPSAHTEGLAGIAKSFLAGAGSLSSQIDRACFGVAGPVSNGHAVLTNLDWQLEESTLSSALGIARVVLINDLVATAAGVGLLGPEKLIQINSGQPRQGANRAVIAAGTGLGEAGLLWNPTAGRHQPFASEGGHCDFAPQSQQEIDLLRFVQHRQGYVEWESVLSGPGLRMIYDFLITAEQLGPASGLPEPDPSPSTITQAALDGTNVACNAALEMFIRFYGCEAGNLALKMLAIGGIYIGGGIAPHIADRLKASTFMQAFSEKGPEKIRALLSAIPIYVINFELCALHGAARYASRL